MSCDIVIGVPGLWKDRHDINTAISRGHKFMFAGMLLLDMQTQKTCELEVYEYDPHLVTAFEIASQGYISAAVLQQLSQHQHTIYAISATASIENAAWMLKVGAGMLEIGGLAIKVESAGLAHSAEQWLAITADGTLSALYRGFVTLITGRNNYYSCGMQNFGLPDTSLSNSISPEDAGQILNKFNYYHLAENPHLQDSNTFSLTPESTRFRMRRVPDEEYEDSCVLHNPFGRWHLEAI